MKKTIQLCMLVLAALALALGVGSLPAAAAPGNSFPGGSAYVDNQTHSISPNTSLWYRFEYAGDRSMITLTLVNGTNSGVAFDVFTPGQIADWWDEAPIGRGTPQALNCSSGMPQSGGACQANDLTWVGNFPESGTYYVDVVNHNSGAMNFTLTIAGTGVTVIPQMTAATASAPQSNGSATNAVGNPSVATNGGSNTDPGHAVMMDSNSHMIPSGTGLWYLFHYVVKGSDVTITMPNGANSGLEFSVYAPGQIGDWWDEQPVGRGTTQAVNCSDVQPEMRDRCTSKGLSWKGSFNVNGTFYVQVFNNNEAATPAQLVIQGEGVTLIP